jgi:rubredoxin
MNASKLLSLAAAAVLSTGLGLVLSGCGTVPEGANKSAAAGGVQLEATGAGIVKADAQKTVFKIKCAVCGFVSDEMTIDTPAAGKPYTLDWVCPKCGHKQKVTIQVAPPK